MDYFNRPMPESHLHPGERVLCEQQWSQIHVQGADSIKVTSRRAHLVLTDRRLLGVRWKRRKGERVGRNFVHLPVDHIRSWETVRTLRLRWFRARRLDPFIRFEVERPEVILGCSVKDPEQWIATLSAIAGQRS